MLVSPVMGFALLVVMMALAGCDMMVSARTSSEKTAAVVFTAILAAFVATLVAMIVI